MWGPIGSALILMLAHARSGPSDAHSPTGVTGSDWDVPTSRRTRGQRRRKLCGVTLRGCKPSTHLPHGVILPAELVWIFGSGEGLSATRRRVGSRSFPARVGSQPGLGQIRPLNMAFLGRISCAFPKFIGGCVMCSVADIPGAIRCPTAVCGSRSIVPRTLWKAIHLSRSATC